MLYNYGLPEETPTPGTPTTLSIDVVGSKQYIASGVGYTGITVGSGTNGLLVVTLAFDISATDPTGISVVWDAAGANQPLEQAIIASQLAGNGQNAAIYYVANPVAGNKTLTVNWTGGGKVFVAAMSFFGANPGPSNVKWYGHGLPGVGSSIGTLTINSATGHYVVGLEVSSTVQGTSTGTLIYSDNTSGSFINAMAQYDSGASTVTIGGTGGFNNALVAVDIAPYQFGAGGGGGTTYNQSVSATSTTTASFLKSVGKKVSVSSTTTTTWSAVKAKLVSILVTSTTTTAFAKSVGKTVAVSATSTTSVAKGIAKTIALACTSTTSWAKAVAKTLALSCTTTTAILAGRLYARTVSVVSTTTTTVIRGHVFAKLIAAVCTSTAAFATSIARAVVSLAPASFYKDEGTTYGGTTLDSQHVTPGSTSSSFYGSGTSSNNGVVTTNDSTGSPDTHGNTAAPASFYQGGGNYT